nr:unconventional myosin-Va [Tanacetum cinerariifolium]
MAVTGSDQTVVPLRPDNLGRFGKFGGKYVPETLMYALTELEDAFRALASDIDFQVESPSNLPEMVKASNYRNRGLDVAFIRHRSRLRMEKHSLAVYEENELFRTHSYLSLIYKSIVGIPQLVDKLSGIQSALLANCLPRICRSLDDRIKSIIKLDRLAPPTARLVAFFRVLSPFIQNTSSPFLEFKHDDPNIAHPKGLKLLNQSRGEFSADFLSSEILVVIAFPEPHQAFIHDIEEHISDISEIATPYSVKLLKKKLTRSLVKFLEGEKVTSYKSDPRIKESINHPMVRGLNESKRCVVDRSQKSQLKYYDGYVDVCSLHALHFRTLITTLVEHDLRSHILQEIASSGPLDMMENFPCPSGYNKGIEEDELERELAMYAATSIAALWCQREGTPLATAIRWCNNADNGVESFTIKPLSLIRRRSLKLYLRVIDGVQHRGSVVGGREMVEKKMENKHFYAALKIAVKAQQLYRELENTHNLEKIVKRSLDPQSVAVSRDGLAETIYLFDWLMEEINHVFKMEQEENTKEAIDIEFVDNQDILDLIEKATIRFLAHCFWRLSFGIDDEKAPGPDGFTVVFFKRRLSYVAFIRHRSRLRMEKNSLAVYEKNELFRTLSYLSLIYKSIVGIPQLVDKLSGIQSALLANCLPRICRSLDDRINKSIIKLDRLAPPTARFVAFFRVLSPFIQNTSSPFLEFKHDDPNIAHPKGLLKLLNQSRSEFSADFLSSEISVVIAFPKPHHAAPYSVKLLKKKLTRSLVKFLDGEKVASYKSDPRINESINHPMVRGLNEFKRCVVDRSHKSQLKYYDGYIDVCSLHAISTDVRENAYRLKVSFFRYLPALYKGIIASSGPLDMMENFPCSSGYNKGIKEEELERELAKYAATSIQSQFPLEFFFFNALVVSRGHENFSIMSKGPMMRSIVEYEIANHV